MEIKIEHFDVSNARYKDVQDIRYKILRRPLGMEITELDIQKALDSIHILLMVDGKPAGTVSLRGNRLRQMAVLSEYQGLSLGRKLVEYLEKLAKEQGITEIILDARQEAIPFYEKLGYECCSDFYEEIGIAHRDMKKRMF